MAIARSTAIMLVASCVVWTSTLTQAQNEAIVGTWLTDAADSKIEIAKNADAYAGKVVWLKQPERNGKPAIDAKNEDPAQRSRPIMGLPILSGISAAGNGLWRGTLYSPQKGRSYPVELSVAKDGRLDLKVKSGMLSKHVLWTRVQ